MRRILASATVDPLPCNMWQVNVWGEPPHDQTRTYTINANTDDAAAQEGLRRFEAEMMAVE